MLWAANFSRLAVSCGKASRARGACRAGRQGHASGSVRAKGAARTVSQGPGRHGGVGGRRRRRAQVGAPRFGATTAWGGRTGPRTVSQAKCARAAGRGEASSQSRARALSLGHGKSGALGLLAGAGPTGARWRLRVASQRRVQGQQAAAVGQREPSSGQTRPILRHRRARAACTAAFRANSRLVGGHFVQRQWQALSRPVRLPGRRGHRRRLPAASPASRGHPATPQPAPRPRPSARPRPASGWRVPARQPGPLVVLLPALQGTAQGLPGGLRLAGQQRPGQAHRRVRRGRVGRVRAARRRQHPLLHRQVGGQLLRHLAAPVALTSSSGASRRQRLRQLGLHQLALALHQALQTATLGLVGGQQVQGFQAAGLVGQALHIAHLAQRGQGHVLQLVGGAVQQAGLGDRDTREHGQQHQQQGQRTAPLGAAPGQEGQGNRHRGPW